MLSGDHGQQHPLGVYFKIWWLFVLSIASDMVDYFHVQGLWRWSLIIVFMLLKAGLIVAVFMHMGLGAPAWTLSGFDRRRWACWPSARSKALTRSSRAASSSARHFRASAQRCRLHQAVSAE